MGREITELNKPKQTKNMNKPYTYRVVSMDEAMRIVKGECSYRIVREAGHPLLEAGEIVAIEAIAIEPVDNSNYCVIGREMHKRIQNEAIFIVTDKAAMDALKEESNKVQLAQKMAFMQALSFGKA